MGRTSRKWTQQQRDDLAKGKIKGDFAGPEHSYPIAGPQDVGDAWGLAAMSKDGDPDTIRRAIIKIAIEYGWTAGLPESAQQWAQEKNIDLAEELADESETGQLCPYADCEHDLAIPEVGWYKCGACGKVFFAADTDSDFEDYHNYQDGKEPEGTPAKPDGDLSVAKDLEPDGAAAKAEAEPEDAETESDTPLAAADEPPTEPPTEDVGVADLADDPYILIDLAAPAVDTPQGKAIEFLRLGHFIDMRGNDVPIDEAMLDTLVANFNAGTAGQDVPIDVQHQRAEAAGWISKIWRQGDRLLALPKWTSLGKQLVGEQIYRYLSASLDMQGKLLKAISLVNFPAVKGLKPIELMAAKPGSPSPERRPAAETPEPILTGGSPMADKPNVTPTPESGAGLVTDNDLAEVRQAIADDLKTAMTAELAATGDIAAPAATPDLPAAVKAADLASVGLSEADLAEMRTTIQADLRTALLAEYQAQRTSMMSELREQMTTERELQEFCAATTSRGAHALPIKPKELDATLRALPKDGRQAVMDLLSKITEAGTVDLSAMGTSREPVDDHNLPAPVAYALSNYLAKFEGATIADFFEANPELGKPAQYDLTDFGG